MFQVVNKQNHSCSALRLYLSEPRVQKSEVFNLDVAKMSEVYRRILHVRRLLFSPFGLDESQNDKC